MCVRVGVRVRVWAPSEAIANDLICGGNTSRSGRPQTARREPGDSDPLSLRDTQEFVVLRGQLAERRAHWAAPVRILPSASTCCQVKEGQR